MGAFGDTCLLLQGPPRFPFPPAHVAAAHSKSIRRHRFGCPKTSPNLCCFLQARPPHSPCIVSAVLPGFEKSPKKCHCDWQTSQCISHRESRSTAMCSASFPPCPSGGATRTAEVDAGRLAQVSCRLAGEPSYHVLRPGCSGIQGIAGVGRSGCGSGHPG